MQNRVSRLTRFWSFHSNKSKNVCQTLNATVLELFFHISREILYVEIRLFTIFETIESIKLNNMNDDV